MRQLLAWASLIAGSGLLASCVYGIFLLASAVMGFANTQIMILSGMWLLFLQWAIKLAMSILLIADGVLLLREVRTEQ
jgi:hypothetical protein